MGSNSSKANPVRSPRKHEDVFKDGYKMVFLGDMCSGKTSIVYRICLNTYEENRMPTTFASDTPKFFSSLLFIFVVVVVSGLHSGSFFVHKMTVDGIEFKLELWDTAGLDRFVSDHFFFSYLCV